ncbi:MAG TPA: hypothetical protein VFE56_12465 [Candidatus Binataceae bacterium]|jgi:hypothetical protein|nr:hypothetical protein [Candidatus Binataceae bacterium]
MTAIVPVMGGLLQVSADRIPDILVRAGTNAVFAAEEFFKATLKQPPHPSMLGRVSVFAMTLRKAPGSG